MSRRAEELLDEQHYTITADDLGDGVELWYGRVFDCLLAMDYYWWTPCHSRRAAAASLHLPPEFPDESVEYEAYDKFEDVEPLCGRDSDEMAFTAKPVKAFPVGSRRICSYCMHDFVQWWHVQSRRATDDGRPPEVVDDG